jgi:hypothetical protein
MQRKQKARITKHILPIATDLPTPEAPEAVWKVWSLRNYLNYMHANHPIIVHKFVESSLIWPNHNIVSGAGGSRNRAELRKERHRRPQPHIQNRRYWAKWKSLAVRNGILERHWQSNGRPIIAQIVLP